MISAAAFTLENGCFFLYVRKNITFPQVIPHYVI